MVAGPYVTFEVGVCPGICWRSLTNVALIWGTAPAHATMPFACRDPHRGLGGRKIRIVLAMARDHPVSSARGGRPSNHLRRDVGSRARRDAGDAAFRHAGRPSAPVAVVREIQVRPYSRQASSSPADSIALWSAPQARPASNACVLTVHCLAHPILAAPRPFPPKPCPPTLRLHTLLKIGGTFR